MSSLAGDDYWIREDLIERMADFLRDHDEIFAVTSRCEVRNGFEETAARVLPEIRQCNKSYTLRDLEEGRFVNLRGIMHRNVFLTEAGRERYATEQRYGTVEDLVDRVFFLMEGPIYCCDEVMTVYRITSDGSSFNASHTRFEKRREYIESLNKMVVDYGDKVDFTSYYTIQVTKAFKDMLHGHNVVDYLKLYRSIPVRFRKPVGKSVGAVSLRRALGDGLRKIGRTAKGTR